VVRPVLAGAIVAALLTAAAAASPPRPANLIATPAVKAALRHAFLTAHRIYTPRRVKGPLKGDTYYGRYGPYEYALAIFDVPRTGTTDMPEIFRRPVGGRWRDLGDTGGEICPPEVPLPLVKLWRFVPSSYITRHDKRFYCYAPSP
jgi:hypothetical protein